MDTRKLNVFVVGLERFNLRLLRSVRNSERYAFFGLLSHAEISAAARFDLEALLRQGARHPARVRRPDRRHRGVLGFPDRPDDADPAARIRAAGSDARKRPALRTQVLGARQLQVGTVPEEVPEFRLVDPFDPEAADKLDLSYPFWLKPIKSALVPAGLPRGIPRRSRSCAGGDAPRHPPLRRADGRDHGICRPARRHPRHRRGALHRRGHHLGRAAMHSGGLCLRGARCRSTVSSTRSVGGTGRAWSVTNTPRPCRKRSRTA